MKPVKPIADPFRPLGRPMNNAGGALNPGALTTENADMMADAEQERKRQMISALQSALPYKGTSLGMGG